MNDAPSTPLPPGAKMSARNVADQLFICESYPTAFLSTPKCGSTFVKHLFWQIDNGAPHETADGVGTGIHKFDDALPRGDRVSVEWVLESPYCFFIVRNPVERILSLYFDKLVNDHDPHWQWFRDLVADLDDVVPVPETPEDHRRNCLIMLRWIKSNISGETDVRLNNHWRPQRMRINMARTLRLKALTLNGLEDQLYVLLGDLIPDLRGHMSRVSSRNAVPRTVPRKDMLDDELRHAIRSLYRRDFAVWKAAQDGWSGIDLGKPDPEAVPRLDPEYL